MKAEHFNKPYIRLLPDMNSVQQLRTLTVLFSERVSVILNKVSLVDSELDLFLSDGFAGQDGFL